MDVKAYIESGIIQDYCLGLLNKEDMQKVEQLAAQYSDIQAEINSYQQALEQYVMDFVRVVPDDFKSETLDILDNLSKESNGLINDLPLLNRYSTPENWLRVVKPLLPAQLEKDLFFKVLRDDERVFQLVLWTKTDYPDEVHEDIKECFMILEGECDCYVGDEIIRLGPGGYLDVPMYTHHDVKVVKGPVLAIVQRLKAS